MVLDSVFNAMMEIIMMETDVVEIVKSKIHLHVLVVPQTAKMFALPIGLIKFS